MGSKVTVYIDLDRGGQQICVTQEMPIWIIEDAIRDIDFPCVDADAFGRFLCIDAVTVEATMKARHEIATALTKALLDAMGAGDKRMGYPKSSSQK
jgi:hypothetical protein